MTLSLSKISCCVIRLHPGDDLVLKLNEHIRRLKVEAAFVLSCVGSLERAKLRTAGATSENRDQYLNVEEYMEIVSLVGTLSSTGSCHLHTSLSTNEGKVIGGHLMSDGGAIVRTTAEIVIGVCDQLQFKREFDQNTGFNELLVSHLQ